MTQFDLTESRLRRDEALAQVSEKSDDFMLQAITIVWAQPKGWEGTGEDIRRLVTERGLTPHSPHAWGALTNHLKRRGIIRKTGERRQMRDVKSHARETDVYVR